MKDTIKQYWRIIILVVLLVSSVGLIMGVTDVTPNPDEDRLTTLQLGLDLSGGTEIRTPIVGWTAEDTTVSQTQSRSVEQEIADELNIPSSDVTIIQRQDRNDNVLTDVEVTEPTITQEEFERALNDQNIGYESVRSGVTEQTRNELVEAIETKINESGLSGGSARTVQSVTGEHFILIQVPGEDRESVRELLDDRGQVRIDIYYPNESDEYETRQSVLTSDDFQRISPAEENQQLGPHVPVVIRESAAQSFRDAVVETGVSGGGSGSSCLYETQPEATGPCLLTVVDEDVVYSAGMAPSLASSMEDGSWVSSGDFVLQTSTLEEANTLSLNLRAGGLPAELDFDNGTVNFISPSQGSQFILYSLLISIGAIIAVAAKVTLSFGDKRVSIPMVLTSLCEVVILLGFAALLQYPIDLAVIGGFIAVIGTGIDDLIIIAEEVLTKGDVKSNRAFNKRYQKAFWVIGAAALTTGVALAPLVVLSLGELRGFAIFTLVGITIGIFITRPAYGTILNDLIVKENK